MNDSVVQETSNSFSLVFVPINTTELLVIWVTSTTDNRGLKKLWSARSGSKLAEFFPTIWSACLVCMMQEAEGFILKKSEVLVWMTKLVKS